MATNPNRRVPRPGTVGSFEELNKWLQVLFIGVDRNATGKMDCTTELTLTANSSSTSFQDSRLTSQSVLTFDPSTANAAAELGNGTLYILAANRGNGTWTITHANNAQTDRTYYVSIIN